MAVKEPQADRTQLASPWQALLIAVNTVGPLSSKVENPPSANTSFEEMKLVSLLHVRDLIDRRLHFRASHKTLAIDSSKHFVDTFHEKASLKCDQHSGQRARV